VSDKDRERATRNKKPHGSEAEDTGASSEPVAGEQRQQQQVEPAPTDFRRHLWLLVLILGVVAAAWLANRVVAAKPEREPEAPASPASTETPAPQEPAVKIPSYRELTEAQRLAARLSIHSVVAGGRRYIVASPAHKPPGSDEAVAPRLFDVTETAEGFDIADTMQLPGMYADRFPLLDQSSDEPPQFAPAKDVTILAPDETVIVVSQGEESRAYPVRILNMHSAVRDDLAGTPILVCWSFVTQMPSCLVIPAEDAKVRWGTAGRFYRGNPVLYDETTGSLWDSFSGLALTGPKTGTRLGRIPATVHPWGEWQARRPEVLTLTASAGYGQGISAMVAAYLADQEQPFPLPGYDPETSGGPPAKAFVIGVQIGAQAKAYPLAVLLEAGHNTLEDELGGEKVVITVTSFRTAHAADAEGNLLDASVMLWSGWKSVCPNTEVWSAPTD